MLISDGSLDDLVRQDQERRGNHEAERFAIVRLMMSSNFMDCITDRSAGLVPLSTQPV